MPQSFGGVSASTKIYLFPMQNAASGAIGYYAFDPSQGFNDPVNPSVYKFKVEQIIPGRIPTISRMILTYRDLGQVTATFALAGTTDQGKVVGNGTPPASSATVTIGNIIPTGVLMTTVQGLVLSAQNLQLSITRRPGAGALSIASIVLCGRVEKEPYG
jgi:hypothetical protein